MKSAAEVEEDTNDRGSRVPFLVFVAVSASTLLVDQLTKWWALGALAEGRTVPVLGDLMRLVLVFNPGAAFGTGANATIVFTAVAIVVSIALLVVARRLGDVMWAVTLGLFLGGAVGNLVDRLFRAPGALQGHVVDFIDWGGLFVGNVADIALTFAAIMVLFRAWTGVRLDGTRDEN